MRHSAATIAPDQRLALAVVQETLGHFRYPGHPWLHARLVLACLGRGRQARAGPIRGNGCEERRSASGVSAGQVEPPIGIEPMTYSLRVNRSAD